MLRNPSLPVESPCSDRISPPTGGVGGSSLKSFADLLPEDRKALFRERPVVCIQGLGFVGAAMAAASAMARNDGGDPCFNVVGVDLDTTRGRTAIDRVNDGRLPFATTDHALASSLARASERGNLVATADPAAYGLADVILIDVNLDLAVDRPDFGKHGALLQLAGFRQAIATVGRWMRPDTLVIVETTVPPGTCERVVAPRLAATLGARGFDSDRLLLAHSYERVMPGAAHLDSIVDYWRVYAGHTPAAADACGAFLSKIVNVADFPLRRLSSTTASETAKVLENSYRAVNIAFIEEWGRFAEAVGVDLFEVVDAIRQRPTHSNIRQPGFGVGGYCLPKDPLMAYAAAREIFDLAHLDFPFCRMAVEINRGMPLVSVRSVQDLLGGSLEGKRIALLGISYRPDVADTRHAPAAIFVGEARRRGATLQLHDPLVRHWLELDLEVPRALPDPAQVDALVFATAHSIYRELDLRLWLRRARPAVLDANDVLTAEQRRAFTDLGCSVASIGRGSKAECGS
ncbi:MAG: nucleotide sugar dehydrogenase [Kiloniellaceae bacterium]